jgi:hypothetical protein
MTEPENVSKEDGEMNANTNRNSIGFTAKTAAAVLAFVIGAAPGAMAGGGSKSSVPVPGAIVSHVKLAGETAARMGVIKKDGKRVLYIEDGSAKIVGMVDVTVPEHPGALERSGATHHVPRLSTAVVASNSPDIFGLLNSIGVKNPQQAHLFSGSARFLADARHSLIFVVDEDGLWIVKARQSIGEYTAPYDMSDYGTSYGG